MLRRVAPSEEKANESLILAQSYLDEARQAAQARCKKNKPDRGVYGLLEGAVHLGDCRPHLPTTA